MTESVVADLKQTGFIDFLYFTDYETTDPIFGSRRAASDRTELRGATSGTGAIRHCGQIQFGQFDTLGGPVHSNDTHADLQHAPSTGR